jgi:D-xylose transport system substrate-binding protein
MFGKRLRVFVPIILLLVGALVLAACSDSDDDGTTTTAAASGETETETEGLIVGVSWNNYNEERWAKADEPAIIAALDAAGAEYISTDAGSSAEQQLADIENLIAQGADALIVLAQDGTAVIPGVQSAIAQGIPVIAYDRLIEDDGAYYITFDNIEVGRMQAREIFKLVPEGNYVFIKGNQADANADFLRGGQQEILQEAIDSGAIVNVGESYTDNWLPDVAQTNMEQFLTANNNEVDAVVASNDGMAGGVVAALAAQGLDGVVPVSGQDGDAAALNRVALGTQSVSVWKDAFALGQTAGEVAVQLAAGIAMADIQGPDDLGDHVRPDDVNTVVFVSPGGNSLQSIILAPTPITPANINIPVDLGWITQDELCQGVPAGNVTICG